MFKFKFLIITLALLLLTGCTQDIGLSTFKSIQVGGSPTAGKILQTNGTDSTWVTTSSLGIVGGGSGSSTPGGSDTQVQFNNNGAFAGDSGLTFNSSTNQLAVTNVTATSITSTNLYVSGTTTLGSNLIMGHSNFLTVHGIKGDASDGLYITANNGTAVADFGVGNTANSIFNGGVNIDGQTRLATSLTGLAYLTSGVVSATNTINIATGTISGGFFQTDFTDCDADAQTVAYDVTTGKFGCGDDDSGGAATMSLTNTLLAFGDADNAMTSSTALSFNTTTLSLIINGTVSSTNALFLNATSTNLNISGLTNLAGTTITNGTSTNFFSVGLQFTNLNGTNVTSTNLFTTNGNFTRATSTDFNATRATFTSVTSTNISITTGLTLPAGSVLFSEIENHSALSVFGRSANSSGVGASIAGTAGQVLRVNSGSVLGFGSLDLQSSAAVSGTLPIGNGGTGSVAAIASMYQRIVTTTGSTVWTKPTSTRFVGVNVWCVGGGGGGGGSGTTSTIGAGGGGGGCSYRTLTASQLSATTSVTVGIAGTLGAAGNNAGGTGGTSSFGSFISCTGGAGGLAGNGADSQSTGGVGSSGNINGSGRNGKNPGSYLDSYRGYGGAACTNQGDVNPDYIQDSISNPMSGGGILGMWGGGGGNRAGNWDANTRNGNGGQYFGGGGSGGQKVGVTNAAGAAGLQGVIVIQELYQ